MTSMKIPQSKRTLSKHVNRWMIMVTRVRKWFEPKWWPRIMLMTTTIMMFFLLGAMRVHKNT